MRPTAGLAIVDRAGRRISPILVGILGGGLVAGWPGLILGAFVGLAHRFRPRSLPIAAAATLVAVAVATIAQGSTEAADVPRYALDRPVAHLLGLSAVIVWTGAAAGIRSSEGVVVVDDHRWSESQSAVEHRSPLLLVALVAAFASAAAAFTSGGLTAPVAAAGATVVVGAPIALRRVAGRGVVRLTAGALGAFRARRVGSSLVTGSTWMLAATAAVSIGSFAFWVLAARITDRDAVGHASAMFTSVFFLAYATSLGLPIAASRFAADGSAAHTTRFRWFCVLTTASSALGATAFAIWAPDDVIDPVLHGGRIGAAFIVFAMVTGVSVSILVDVRLMGRGRYDSVFWRSVAISVLRIVPFAVIPATDDGWWLFVVAAGAYAVTALVYLPGLVRHDADHPDSESATRREVAHFAVVNYASQLAVQAPFYVTPLVVAVAVATDENAEFYLSWGIMSVVFIGIQVIGQALLVEGSRPSAERRSHVRLALFACSGIAVAATVTMWSASGVAAALYGSGFSEVASILPPLMTGTVAWAVVTVALAEARIRRDTPMTLLITVAFALSALGGVVVGVVLGDALGAALGWLVGTVAAVPLAVVSLVRSARAPLSAYEDPDPGADSSSDEGLASTAPKEVPT